MSQQPPFVYKTEGCDDNSEKYSRCYTGYCIDLLDLIQEELGFNYTIRNVSDYGYMSDTGNHEWDGMVKELKDRVIYMPSFLSSSHYLSIFILLTLVCYAWYENFDSLNACIFHTESRYRIGSNVCDG